MDTKNILHQNTHILTPFPWIFWRTLKYNLLRRDSAHGNVGIQTLGISQTCSTNINYMRHRDLPSRKREPSRHQLEKRCMGLGLSSVVSWRQPGVHRLHPGPGPPSPRSLLPALLCCLENRPMGMAELSNSLDSKPCHLACLLRVSYYCLDPWALPFL